jgi:hypothetical protein
MSSIWKTAGKGGMAKVKTFPCYCCAITTATLVTPQLKDNVLEGIGAGNLGVTTMKWLQLLHWRLGCTKIGVGG